MRRPDAGRRLLGAGAAIVTLLVACSAIPIADAQFDRVLAAVNARLARPDFRSGSVIHLESAGPCVVLFRSTGSRTSAAAKGFAEVETVTPIRLGRDFAGIRRVQQHDDRSAADTEGWVEQVRIRFTHPGVGQFTAKAQAGAHAETHAYSAGFLSIGLSRTVTTDAVAGLVGALGALGAVCSGGENARARRAVSGCVLCKLRMRPAHASVAFPLSHRRDHEPEAPCTHIHTATTSRRVARP